MYTVRDTFVDILIVGTGLSGLYSALNLDPSLNILMLTKGKLRDSNSYLAQGGIAVTKDDKDVSTHIKDTLKAGKFLNDFSAVRTLVEESRSNLRKLIDLGIKFDENEGGISYTKEAAHSTNRIVHVKDETGKAVVDSLLGQIIKRKNISILEDCLLVDLITEGNRCVGAVALEGSEQINIYSKVTILATGGIGGLFKNSTNQRSLTGDGVVLAFCNNIHLKNLQYIQFHPTALYEENLNIRRLLISESLRGEGAKLINIHGKSFINELLPRDVVTEAILNEMEKTESPFVYLDVSFLPEDYIKFRFPYIYQQCLNRGTDITKDYIKVSPAQHYFMGGIAVDLNSTSMKNLYAVGETSCTGVHGANRLASNSLLEALVFSKRAAEDIEKRISHIKIQVKNISNLNYKLEDIKFNNIKTAINIFKGKVENKSHELVNY